MMRHEPFLILRDRNNPVLIFNGSNVEAKLEDPFEGSNINLELISRAELNA